MLKLTTKFVLVISFGRGTATPWRKIRFLIIIFCVGLLFLSNIIIKLLGSLKFSHDIPSEVLFFTIAVFFFVICGFIILPTCHLFDNRQTVYAKNLLILPLSRNIRWYISVLPISLIVILISLLFIPITISISHELDLNVFIAIIAYILAILATTGLSLFNGIRSAVIKYISFVGISYLLLYLLDKEIKTYNYTSSHKIFTLTFSIFIICSLGLIYRYIHPFNLKKDLADNFNNFTIPKKYLKIFWYAIKYLRNQKSLSSFLFSFIISSSLVIISILKHRVFFNPQFIITFCSVLLTSVACDSRGICRYYKVPEIFTLKGVKYFVRSQIISLVLLDSVILMPIFYYFIKNGSQITFIQLIDFVCILIASSLFGLLSSSIFVPENGEIGAQFFTAIFALTGILAFSKILSIPKSSFIISALNWIIFAIVCYFLIILIEGKRSKKNGYSR